MSEVALHADWTFVGERFERDRVVVIDAAGRVAAVESPVVGRAVRRLEGRALLPAFVNAHSHAFQRTIRGRTEVPGPAEVERADFWSWRTRMYAAARRLSVDDAAAVSRWAFVEMARAGYGTVAEFHYLHHDPDGRPYAVPIELDLEVARAALDAGIRVTLLRAAYERGGLGAKPGLAQQRFAEPDVATFLARTAALDGALASRPRARVGVAPHSLRAIGADWLRAIAIEARRRGWPLHVHACEQPAELESVRAEHGRTPIEVLAHEGALDARTTVVHGIHVSERDVASLAATGATVCACPTTEANLGDGICPADRLAARGVPLALGTDSHASIDPFAEMRGLESHLRLARLRRCVFTPEELLGVATEGCARAAGWPELGRIEVGAPADLCAVDLRSPAFAGCTGDAATLAATLILGGGPRDVTDTWVGGEPVVVGGRHPLEIEARAAFERVQRRLWR